MPWHPDHANGGHHGIDLTILKKEAFAADK